MPHDTWGLPQPLLMGKLPASMYLRESCPTWVSNITEMLRCDTSGLCVHLRQHLWCHDAQNVVHGGGQPVTRMHTHFRCNC